MIEKSIFETAYRQAEQAYQADEVPVGAVVFDPATNQIITAAHNQTQTRADPTAHAELLAIQEACRILNVKRLDGYALFVTLEPCVMCAGAIAWAHLSAVYYGAPDVKTGAIEQGACVFTHPQTHHKPRIFGGIEAEKCSALLTSFFQQKRRNQKERKQQNGND